MRRPRPVGRRKGSALVVAVVVVIMVSAFGGAYLTLNISRARRAAEGILLDEAQHIADSGLDLARRFLFVYRQTGSWSWNDILAYNSTFPTDPEAVRETARQVILNKGRGGAIAATTPEAPVPPPPTNLPTTDPPVVFGVHTLFGHGAWYIVVRNNSEEGTPLLDSDNVLVVHVIATTADGLQRAIEARVSYEPPTFVPRGAIVTVGDLRVSGNPTVRPTGSGAADIMARGDIVITGNAAIDGKARAGGAVELGGQPQIRDGTENGAPPFPLPVTDPEEYRSMADYTLRGDGKVVDSSGNVVARNDWYNLKFEAGEWRSSPGGGPTRPPAGVLFFETDLTLDANIELNNTIISTGSVSLTGSAGGGDPQLELEGFLQGVAILAGGDVKISGAFEVRGFVVANEQIYLGGGADILNGGLLAMGKRDASDVVVREGACNVRVVGDSVVNFPPGTGTFLKLQVYSLAMDQIRRVR